MTPMTPKANDTQMLPLAILNLVTAACFTPPLDPCQVALGVIIFLWELQSRV